MTTVPTPLDLTAIEQRANAATEGPWVAHPDGLVWADRPGDPVSGSTEIEDAEFIAAARTDVPALLAEVKRLTKAIQSQTAVANAALAGSARRQAELDRLRAGINDTMAALRAAAMAEDGQPAYSFAAGLNDGLQLATARLRALLDGPR